MKKTAKNKSVVHDGLENVVAGLGTSHDKRAYGTWALPPVLTRQHLENMYRGSWLAKRIVNTVADDMTREWVHFLFDDMKDTDRQPFQIEEAAKKLGVQTKVNEALRWARLYGGSVILLGLDDIKEPEDWKRPYRIETAKKGCLRYMRVLDRWRISAGQSLTDDISDENFGLPEFYTIADSSTIVHHSRVIRFNGQKLPYFAWTTNAMWDDSELQHVLDSLMNCDLSTQAVATMLYESNVDVIKSPQITNLLATKDGESKVLKRFQVAAMMKSFNRTLLLDGQEEYEKKSNTFANLHDIMERFAIDVCGAAEIPMMRLFGQSAPGLNATGESDLANYYDKVGADQEATLRPNLDRIFHLVCCSTLGSVPKNFRLEFNDLWQLPEKDRAVVEKAQAERDKIYTDMGVIDVGLIARELLERGTYRTMTSEDVKDAEAMAEDLLKKAQELEKNGDLNLPASSKPKPKKKGATE